MSWVEELRTRNANGPDHAPPARHFFYYKFTYRSTPPFGPREQKQKAMTAIFLALVSRKRTHGRRKDLLRAQCRRSSRDRKKGPTRRQNLTSKTRSHFMIRQDTVFPQDGSYKNRGRETRKTNNLLSFGQQWTSRRDAESVDIRNIC